MGQERTVKQADTLPNDRYLVSEEDSEKPSSGSPALCQTHLCMQRARTSQTGYASPVLSGYR